ncbi:hypothetical protein NN561_015808 [Cricetulus griseus]
MHKNLWAGFGKGIPAQVPREAAPPATVATYRSLPQGLSECPWEDTTRTSHWTAFLSYLRKPRAGLPFGSSILSQEPEPPHGGTGSLSAAAAAGGTAAGARAPAGWVPAEHSPPRLRVPSRPRDGLSLTSGVAGDSHTWFPVGAAGAGLWAAYVIALPPLAISPTQGTGAQNPTQGTNPGVQMLSKPNLGPALNASPGQPQVPSKAQGQSQPCPHPRPASPGQLPASRHGAVPHLGYQEPRVAGAHHSGRRRSATLPNLHQLPGRSLRAPPAKSLLRSTHECSP